MKRLGVLMVLLVVTAGLLTWGVVGTSAADQRRAACRSFIGRGQTFQSETVTLDQGMKTAARRARETERLARDKALKHALIRFARNAESRTWPDDGDFFAATRRAGLDRILFLCSEP